MKRKITEKLVSWKAQTQNRMPMLVYGARQVGKTFSILEFGKEHYKDTVYVNFELEPGLIPYFEGNISPEQVISILERYLNIKIIKEETLIVFDEIQLCERALTALKYFTELAPEIHLIGAGSLLGVAINRNKFSFPVGKVYMTHMYPMDFQEFLWAKGKQLLADEICRHYEDNSPISKVLHQEALNDYYDYLVTGGMPSVVKTHLSKEVIVSEKEIRNLILNAYVSDMAKYASASVSVKTKGVYDSIPMQLAKENRKFQYKLIKSGARASLYEESIDWLILSGVVLKCTKCQQGYMPPKAYQDLASYKLYMSDVGLLAEKAGITLQALGMSDSNQYLGAMTENYVANSLASNGFELMYWESKGSAEVDFLIVKNDAVIPIEVKSSQNTKSKSLMVYTQRYKPKYAIRISTKNFGYENGIKSVPLYGVFAIIPD